MGLFSGAFSNYRFNVQEQNRPAETLPQMNMKPLEIVEPQMLGKSSTASKMSLGSTGGLGENINNDFNPASFQKNQTSDVHNYSEPKFNKKIVQDQKFSMGAEPYNTPQKKPITDELTNNSSSVASSINFKTLFIGKDISVDLFDENMEEITVNWYNQTMNSSLTNTSNSNPGSGTNSQKELGNQNINTKQNLSKSENFEPTSKPEPTKPLAQSQPPKKPKAPKQPITIQSIFEKYRKLNKTVSKVVHKSNNGRTEKWVYFKDGTSVLEDPGYIEEDSEEEESQDQIEQSESNVSPMETEKNSNPTIPASNPYVPPSQRTMNQPSNVYNFDHQGLVAEFDPENPRNIAITLYEITTRQQRHLYCKYFDPSPHPKFQDLINMIDFNHNAHPTVYHNVDQLDDAALLKNNDKKETEPTHFWTKTLRKSNRGLISKKNKIIKK